MAHAKEDFAQLRRTMVDCQLRTFDVTDHGILERMTAIPREAFLAESQAVVAYSDKAVVLEMPGVTRRLLPPMVLARLLQAADIEPTDKVLTIGGGSGYGAAIAAGLAESVVALENEGTLSERAAACFAALGIDNARSVTGALDGGQATVSPFDVIVVEGAFEREPKELLLQLAIGGRLVGIERSAGDVAGRAVRFDRSAGAIGKQVLFSCSAQVLPGLAAESVFTF